MMKPLYSPAVNLFGADIKHPTALAPLAGWSDSPFRRLCRRYGADILYTEMVSADGIIRKQKKTLELARFDAEERPIGVQIFGADPETVGKAVEIISQLKPDFIDLNFGCPAKKVIRRGAGCALMRNLPKLRAVAAAAVHATDLPVTAKLRSGWDIHSIQVVEAAQVLEEVGIAAVAVHPRTQSMQFRGQSDWSLITAVKKAVSIPVIGNGDIETAYDAEQMLQQTGCDGIMIGRAAFGNPWIFKQIKDYLEKNREPHVPSYSERLHVCLRHLELSKETFGEKRCVFMMRKQLSLYFKGFPNATQIRKKLFSLETFDDIKKVIFDQLNFYEKSSAMNE